MRRILLGTDWWTDCDDAVALRLLTRAAKRGEIEWIGVGINACMEHSVAAMRAFLQNDGLYDIPVGIDRAATDFGGSPSYQKRLAARLPGVSNANAEDAVQLYRRLLAESDEPVEIAEIGFLQVVVAVLQSEGDDISPLSGIELFRQKVKQLWVMAGKWDGDGEKEHNFCLNPCTRAAGRRFCELCPVPVTFLGWEIGYGVLTGGHLSLDDPLRGVLVDHGSADGRHSWDPMLVMLALIGDPQAAGYSVVTGTATVDEDTGANHFIEHADGRHQYVVKQQPDSYYQEWIDNRL